ncbi:hypothetical protein SAMN05192545_2526 [Maribacter dokdonensis]|uniref:Ribbon-helix-helix protein, copG family n=1 Tax=Maribacter dokdonensis TaxID=320912 RepID=A0ABY0UPK4_9FLAO|nr:hypothetical protein [Maribacter dokdonensis]SDS99495.1 hypothetical protein SAMN05192545_2526 [Maribacter dokdonensis]
MSKEEFNDLIVKVQASKPEKSIQKVAPEESINKNAKIFSFHIDKTVLKKLKAKALEEDRSVKSIINESILNYLKQ